MRFTRNLTWLILAAFFIFPHKADAQIFVEALSGRGFNLNSDLNFVQPTSSTDVRFLNVRWKDESFKSPIYFGYGIGYFFKSKSWLGLRAQFVHNKAISQTENIYFAAGTLNGLRIQQDIVLQEVIQSFEVSHGLNTVTFSPVVRLNIRSNSKFPNGRFQLYGGSGAGFIIIHPESTVLGIFNEPGYMLDFPAIEVFSGLRAHINPKWFISGEYKFMFTGVNAPVAGGKANVNFKNHHLVLGVGMSFP